MIFFYFFPSHNFTRPINTPTVFLFLVVCGKVPRNITIWFCVSGQNWQHIRFHMFCNQSDWHVLVHMSWPCMMLPVWWYCTQIVPKHTDVTPVMFRFNKSALLSFLLVMFGVNHSSWCHSAILNISAINFYMPLNTFSDEYIFYVTQCNYTFSSQPMFHHICDKPGTLSIIPVQRWPKQTTTSILLVWSRTSPCWSPSAARSA